jgi:hypothetical protein
MSRTEDHSRNLCEQTVDGRRLSCVKIQTILLGDHLGAMASESQ